MNAREAIELNLNMSDMVLNMYLGDLEDSDLLVRPVPGCNHIAWQLGHLIISEHDMVETLAPGSMPALPAGFAEMHKSENSKFDSSSAFLSKAEYLKIYAAQRAATIAALHKQTDAQLDGPPPEQFKDYTKNIGDVWSLQGSHYMMHLGQWAVVRRKLGRKPMF